MSFTRFRIDPVEEYMDLREGMMPYEPHMNEQDRAYVAGVRAQFEREIGTGTFKLTQEQFDRLMGLSLRGSYRLERGWK